MDKKYRVLILKKYDQKTFEIIKSCFPDNWEITALNISEAKKHIADTDFLIPEHAPVTDALMAKAGKLKIIQTGAGYDNVDIEAAGKLGIKTANASGINAVEVAEHVFAFIFTWHKQLIRLDREMKEGKWPEKVAGKSLSGLTIGIIGFGNIGRKTAAMANSMGMKILVYTRSLIDTGRLGFSVEQKSFEEVISSSDIITLHLPLSKSTGNIISRKEFQLMKKNAFIINTSRGGLIDENDLIYALENRLIAGAGLDVFKTEPLPFDSRLRKLDNIILSPHTAAEPDFEESYRKRFSFFYRNICTIMETGKENNFTG